MTTPIQNTIVYLKACRRLRDAGQTVSFITDPAWLVHMAINRRAGWPDDPSECRGSARPIIGYHGTPKPGWTAAVHYPRKAEGSTYNRLRTIAREVNTPRLIVRPGQLGEWRKLILARMPGRITFGEAREAATCTCVDTHDGNCAFAPSPVTKLAADRQIGETEPEAQP